MDLAFLLSRPVEPDCSFRPIRHFGDHKKHLHAIRRRGDLLLVARPPFPWVLREWKTEEDQGGGRTGADLCDAPNGRGGTWNTNDAILFAPAIISPVSRVPAAGGTQCR